MNIPGFSAPPLKRQRTIVAQSRHVSRPPHRGGGHGIGDIKWQPALDYNKILGPVKGGGAGAEESRPVVSEKKRKRSVKKEVVEEGHGKEEEEDKSEDGSEKEEESEEETEDYRHRVTPTMKYFTRLPAAAILHGIPGDGKTATIMEIILDGLRHNEIEQLVVFSKDDKYSDHFPNCVVENLTTEYLQQLVDQQKSTKDGEPPKKLWVVFDDSDINWKEHFDHAKKKTTTPGKTMLQLHRHLNIVMLIAAQFPGEIKYDFANALTNAGMFSTDNTKAQQRMYQLYGGGHSKDAFYKALAEASPSKVEAKKEKKGKKGKEEKKITVLWWTSRYKEYSDQTDSSLSLIDVDFVPKDFIVEIEGCDENAEEGEEEAPPLHKGAVDGERDRKPGYQVS